MSDKPNAKLLSDLDRVIASHNGDAALEFTKKNWADLIRLYSNRQPAPMPPLLGTIEIPKS